MRDPVAAPSIPTAADAGDAASGSITPMRRPLVALIRPRQWIKNTFVLAPLVFAGQITHAPAIVNAVAATVLFCLVASAAYVINDLADVRWDRAHPVKRRIRPIAAGAVSTGSARLVLATLVVPLAIAAVAWPPVGGVLVLYLGINVAYSLRLKHVPVVDLFCIAAGFVLRVWVGALAIQVPLSGWMLITTLCLALYLAAVKRRQELARRGRGARRVLAGYSVVLLDRYAEMAATATILFYGLYVLEVQPALVITIPVVLFGLFRYWYLTESGEGESPADVLYRDPPLLLAVIAWTALSIGVIAGG